jgi:hypothetical protein
VLDILLDQGYQNIQLLATSSNLPHRLVVQWRMMDSPYQESLKRKIHPQIVLRWVTLFDKVDLAWHCKSCARAIKVCCKCSNATYWGIEQSDEISFRHKDKRISDQTRRKLGWKNKDVFLEIKGQSDSDYAKDLEGCRSVSGFGVFINKVSVSIESKMQESVTLSLNW